MHKPVLLHEVIQLLNPRPGEDFIDATFGGGGHALEILKQTAPGGKLLGIDWDSEGPGLETGSENLIASEPLAPTETSELRSGIEPAPLSKRLFLEHGNFADIDDISNRYFSDGVDSTSSPQVDGVLFDFGFSSFHIDESGRGFSYSKDEPLDMRYNAAVTTSQVVSLTANVGAAEIVNTWPERELERIFREFGEERAARKIARAIVEARRQKRIKTTGELVEIIDKSYRTNRIYKSHKTYSRIFQALRIAVNDELENIKKGLAGAWRILKPGGRLAVISFHSLEDRLVKNFFNGKKQETLGQVLTKKPLTASAEEIGRNPRSRSAKLRAILKLK